MPPHTRRCLSCRCLGHKSEFWRVVRLAQSQTVVLDQGQGRSAYLCPQASCLHQARKKNHLGRVLKAPIPAEIYTALASRLTTIREDESSSPLLERPSKLPKRPTRQKDGLSQPPDHAGLGHCP
ncbi:YlxR family protein [Synechococcus sp. PCC 6312]|uniref:YlxR family protein n=1 Tax=Synechococcus sp. (strain ATCC 27167 / PCC 6312) TaxID=195253 RepID=UPI00029F36EA|nr:putative nucleic-acid-binding protein implicated in transcription termination [Synechococcus sp. PCC 6312]